MITREELEKEITEKEASIIALKKIEYKGYNAYICKCFNGFAEELNTVTFFNGIKIKYLTNPNYVVNKKTLEDYIIYVEKQLKIKCYDNEELKTISNYEDYKNKLDFIINILYQTLEGVTIYNSKYNEKDYPYHSCLFCNFKTKENTLKYNELFFNLKKAFNEKMKEEDFFTSAIEIEMYNHESGISWEGFTPALDSLGIEFEKLDNKFQNIVLEVYKKVCRETNC